jgi:hypothetical protein
VSLLAHIAVFGAWFATHPRPLFVEPATMQIELIRPPPRVKPLPKPAHAAPPIRLHPSNRATPPGVAPLVAPSPPTAQPTPAGPHAFTDEELLAGAKPSIEQLRNAPIRDSAIRNGPLSLPCKPASQRAAHDPAPPCPVFKDSPDAHAKREVKAYKDRYGPSGLPSANDYPSLRCRFAHTNCSPGDPSMDPLRHDH